MTNVDADSAPEESSLSVDRAFSSCPDSSSGENEVETLSPTLVAAAPRRWRLSSFVGGERRARSSTPTGSTLDARATAVKLPEATMEIYILRFSPLYIHILNSRWFRSYIATIPRGSGIRLGFYGSKSRRSFESDDSLPRTWTKRSIHFFG